MKGRSIRLRMKRKPHPKLRGYLTEKNYRPVIYREGGRLFWDGATVYLYDSPNNFILLSGSLASECRQMIAEGHFYECRDVLINLDHWWSIRDHFGGYPNKNLKEPFRVIPTEFEITVNCRSMEQLTKICADADFLKRKNPVWGKWKFCERTLELVYQDHGNYAIDLERCDTAQRALGWILHLKEKKWVSKEDLYDLISALQFLLRINESMKTIIPEEVIATTMHGDLYT